MGMSTHELVPVTEASQVSAARYAAQGMATTCGFSQDDVHRIGLVTTELASNLVKHTGVGGAILLCPVCGDGGGVIDITSIDRGPGMADPGRAMTDGYSTAGSLGGGLGAVRRLSDETDFYTAPGKGTAIFVRIGRMAKALIPAAFLTAGVQVAARGERVSGDAWQVWADGSALTLAIADGLGHGPDAARAATVFLDVLEHGRARAGADAMQDAHLALRPTRGAAAAIAAFDAERAVIRFIGVGNIAMVVSEPGAARHAVSLGGTLGHEARSFREYTYPWQGRDSVAVMHSDGLASHWSLDTYPGLRARTPAVIAAVLYRDHTRGRDDTTVVVVKAAS
jgi:anti-sigma regulatory factor (Ser/Thr protein kinase)